MDVPAAAREEHEKSATCIDERRFVDAIVHAEAAARLCPDWASPWWQLTVGYKHAGRWQDVLRAHDRVMALSPDDAEGPTWNAGIAATALGLWPRARAAWTAAGIELPPGEGPIEMGLGPTPIRVAPETDPEVVWCDRLDPCRARIRSVPLPDSGRRYDDLLLHDGEPRGTRQFRGRAVAVFDELAVLEASAFGTWEVVVRAGHPEELAALLEELHEAELNVEDWTDSVRVLCAQCSLGDPRDHAEHDGPAEPGWAEQRRLGVAVRSESELHPLRRARLWWRREVLSVKQVL
jgi:hypothetical protein